jgi:hypothetical protein
MDNGASHGGHLDTRLRPVGEFGRDAGILARIAVMCNKLDGAQQAESDEMLKHLEEKAAEAKKAAEEKSPE